MQITGAELEEVRKKASILVEALPYIKKFQNRTVVIKYGGNAMTSPELKQAVMQDVVLMKFVGMNPVVVHGGGPAINQMLDRVHKKSEFIHGMRVTDEEVMEIVEMVLGGKVNKEIVSAIHLHGGKAMGLSGKDGGLITARKKRHYASSTSPTSPSSSSSSPAGQAEEIDLGFVGEVEDIKASVLHDIIDQGYIPVVAPIGLGKDNQTYNINADYVAGKVAEALGADKFVLLTDTAGIYDDRAGKKELLSSLSVDAVADLIDQGVIDGGMIPKVETCVEAIKGGVRRVHIIDGRIPHAVLLEIFTSAGIGTMIIK